MRALITIGLTLALATSAQAATVVHSSAGAFTATQTENFEGAWGNSNSVVFGDLTFNSTNGSGIHRTTGFGGSTTRLASQNSGGIEIVIGGNHRSIGFEFGELFSGATSATFNVYDTNGASLYSASGVNAPYFGPSPDYIGWTSDVNIGRVVINMTGSHGFETLDNVSLGNGSTGGGGGGAVPEPGAASLLLLSGLLFARRRR